ncbi:phosphoethanolamine transferase [Oxalobacteraceae bacterium A2-2]
MRSLLRPASLFLLLSYLLLSAVPYVPLLLGGHVEQPWRIAAASALLWLAVWAVFQRPAWFHWLLLPAFLALPTELYLFKFYGQGISTHHLGIIAETSPKESMEFLGGKVWWMAAVMLAVLAWWALTWRLAWRGSLLAWRGWTRWAALGVLLVLAGVLAYGWEFGVAARPAFHASASSAASSAASASASDEEEEDEAPSVPAIAAAGHLGWHWTALPWWARSPLDAGAYNSAWPFGLMGRGYDFYKERVYLADLGRRSSSFRFNARQAEPSEEPEVVVMVIGESSRYDRWSLNGYKRDTNPLLKNEANLITLADMITPVSATRLSVPVIISRKPAMQSLKDGFYEKSFLTAYKEAGFKTWWLSNQISFGQFDTPVSVFAKEADVIQFMNLGGFTNNSNFDQILLDPLRLAMADPAKKKLIVLHTLGNHWNYSQRYPREFDKWQPSLFGVDKPVYTDLKIKPQLNNSYDNSILYTDWFLSRVVGQLKDSNQLAAMMYVADHGQTLYDNSCNLAFHGHNTQFEFHVPALVWYSDQYRERYPGKIEQLQRHRKARLATENIFHTLLDLGDIVYPGQKLDWSFASAAFKPHKRYVDSYGWTNYDNASFKGDCREVIDRAKPLRQEK